jgi:hypothetical protein
LVAVSHFYKVSGFLDFVRADERDAFHRGCRVKQVGPLSDSMLKRKDFELLIVLLLQLCLVCLRST